MENKSWENIKFMQESILFVKSKKIYIDLYTYWKTSQTFHTNPTTNPSLCTTGDGDQTFKLWASPEL